MAITIKKVQTKGELKEFIKFPDDLYKGNEYYVPALFSDEVATLSKHLNPAFECCEADYFLAYKDGVLAGRIAAIINHNANNDWHEEIVRFGWIDMIDDIEVTKALIEAVEQWGRERGCVKIKGPLGFTDMDKEGLLVEGFDILPSITVIYNYPYYGEHLEKLGFTKDVDWTQKMFDIPEEKPEILHLSERLEQKFKLHFYEPTNKKDLYPIAYDLFKHTYNEAFAPLYEFTRLSDKQITTYINQYFPLLNLKLIGIVMNEKNEVVGFGICFPRLSRAMQKAKGRMFPFGWFHLLRALKPGADAEALMIGVHPEYQGKGALVVMCAHLFHNFRDLGIKKIYMNPQLELNYKVQTAFDYLNPVEYMRRRSYVKEL